MSENDRKSMDDVLASIRRIVRSDTPDAISDEEGSEVSSAEAAEEPLLLTPEMRIDGGAEAAGGTSEEDDAEPSAGPAPGPRAGSPAPDALHAMVRAILLEELGDGPGRDAVRDAVREVVRDELVHGEIGDNVSRNVVQLVRDEVARLTGGR